MKLICSLILFAASFLIEGAQAQFGCSATLPTGDLLDIDEGEAFPADLEAARACGPAAEWPCFCDTNNEVDNSRCPYCGFGDINGTIVCARDGGRVVFINDEGLRLSCPCIYQQNSGNGSPFCDVVSDEEWERSESPTSAPESTGMVTAAPTAVPVTSGMPTVMPDVETTTESPSSPSDATVGDNTTVATDMPTDMPTDKPTAKPSGDESTCSIRISANQCAGVMPNAPAEGTCDCYAFCDGEFLDCDLTSINTADLGCDFNSLIVGCTDADRPPSAGTAVTSSRFLMFGTLVAIVYASF